MAIIRFFVLFVIVVCGAAAVSAQDAAPESPDAVLAEARATAEALVAEAARHAEQARAAMEDANRYASDASGFLNIFEAIGSGLGVIGLILSVAGVTGIGYVIRARSQLLETKAKIEADLANAIAERRSEMQSLYSALREASESQKKEAENATLALSMLPLAERQYRASDYEGALRTYQQALALDPDNPIILYRIGYVYEKLNQLDEAEYHLEQARRIFRVRAESTEDDDVLTLDFAPALAALGLTLRKKAAAMSPDDSAREIMMDQAKHNLILALQRQPSLVDEDGESWYGSLGGWYTRNGNLDKAIECYEKAARITPNSSYPLVNLASLYMERGDRTMMLVKFQQAERAARAKTQSEPSDFYAHGDLLTVCAALSCNENFSDVERRYYLESAQQLLPIVYELSPSAGQLDGVVTRLKRVREVLDSGSDPDCHIDRIVTDLERYLSRRTDEDARANAGDADGST